MGFLIYSIVFFTIIYFLNISFHSSNFIIYYFCLFIFRNYSSLKNFKDSDPQEIVIDEFVGQSIPIILFEIFHGDQNYSAYDALQIYFWFFLLFRVFDGLKPFPIDFVDKKFKNTFGILFDDILAGIYVVLCLILFMVGKTYLLSMKKISENLVKSLKKKKLTLAIAESCTGGLLSSSITQISGSSKVFQIWFSYIFKPIKK